jgi:hypothetical protein
MIDWQISAKHDEVGPRSRRETQCSVEAPLRPLDVCAVSPLRSQCRLDGEQSQVVGSVSRLQVREAGRHRPVHPNPPVRSQGHQSQANNPIRPRYSRRSGSRGKQQHGTYLHRQVDPSQAPDRQEEDLAPPSSARARGRGPQASPSSASEEGGCHDSASASAHGACGGKALTSASFEHGDGTAPSSASGDARGVEG